MTRVAVAVGLCSYAGILYGIISFIILNYLVDLFIRLIYGLQPLNTIDKNVFYDQVSNRCNIVAAVVFERTSAEAVREILQRRLPNKW